MRNNNYDRNMKRVGELIDEGFAQVKGSSLQKLVKRIERMEDEYYEQIVKEPKYIKCVEDLETDLSSEEEDWGSDGMAEEDLHNEDDDSDDDL